MADFPSRLKALREENSLLQKELAAILKLNRATLASWESGNRTPELGTAEKLADFFKVSIDYLLGRTNERQPDSEMHALSLSPDELVLLKKYRQMQERQKNVMQQIAETIIPGDEEQAAASGK